MTSARGRLVGTRSRRTGKRPGRPPRLRPEARRAILGAELVGLWAAWRYARSDHWAAVLAERKPAHALYWENLAQRRGEILYVAIGDSTAQGIGARDPARSYVGQLERMLDANLRVVNLSISGARLSDIITSVLPRLEQLELDNALVTFAAGANNIADFDPERFRQDLATILDALPPHALVADIPSFYVHPYQPQVRAANAILHELADARDLAVVPLFAATNRIGAAALALHHAPDLFHPNDRGYRIWARTFLGPAAARVEALSASD